MEKKGSWVWQSIVKCKASFLQGACFKVERQSRIKIRDTPWIPSAPQFMVPTIVTIPESLVYVKDTMNSTGTTWNINLQNLFPLDLVRMIMKVSILNGLEQDALLWVPSKMGNFSIKSCYRENHMERFLHNSNISRDQWK